jgi:hypothetical protein
VDCEHEGRGRPVSITVDEGLVARMKANSGACHVQLQGAADAEVARLAMTKARQAVLRIPHPEEPSDPLPSFASNVVDSGSGPQFWFDVADAEAYDGLVETIVDTMVLAVREAGLVSGQLTWPEVHDDA